MEIILTLLVTAAITAATAAVLLQVNRQRIITTRRMDDYLQDTKEDSINLELNRSWQERILKPVLQFMERAGKNFIPQGKKVMLDKQLLLAGNPHGLTADTFIAVKLALMAAAILIGIIARNILLLCTLIIIAIYAPSFYLRIEQKNRREEIVKSLPDVLDLLMVSVEAGLGFDAALQKVIDQARGPLAFEFDKALQEINLGKPRREALRDMAQRVESNDLTTFVGSIIQADLMGVSIGNVLRIQANQCRANRRMRAREKAQQAPIKILIPLVLFIFPTIFIVLLGPAVIQLMDTFK